MNEFIASLAERKREYADELTSWTRKLAECKAAKFSDIECRENWIQIAIGCEPS